MGAWSKPPPVPVRGLAALLIAGALGGVGCGSARTATTATSTTRAPLGAGVTPSPISQMVCSAKTHAELAAVLGVTGSVSAPTWSDHVYACRYSYPDGFFTLSVKELSSWPQTYAYFAALGQKLGNTGAATGLGQGAFNTTDGSVVVRKDWKVLTVDISGLPPRFGVPPTSAADVAYTIADEILGCWAGD